MCDSVARLYLHAISTIMPNQMKLMNIKLHTAHIAPVLFLHVEHHRPFFTCDWKCRVVIIRDKDNKKTNTSMIRLVQRVRQINFHWNKEIIDYTVKPLRTLIIHSDCSFMVNILASTYQFPSQYLNPFVCLSTGFCTQIKRPLGEHQTRKNESRRILIKSCIVK